MRGGEGAEVIYALRNNSKLSDRILDNLSKLGLKKRRVYQRRLPSDSKKDYYYMLRDTGKNEAIIVEYGFIDNKNDLEFIKNNYDDVAEAAIKAILEYKNIKYTEPVKEIVDTYKVMLGDTLYSIARKLDTTVGELKKINGLTSDIIGIGQILKIPTKSIDIGDNDIYQVKSGDTLYSIANKFNITVDILKGLNDLSNDNLSVGMLLNVPSGLSTANTYIVDSGDTLYSIAKRFNVSILKLKEINNLSSNMLSIGQKLIIPTLDETTYTVKKDDTLYSIARYYNTTVSELKRLNNLTNDILSIGQKLIIRDI